MVRLYRCKNCGEEIKKKDELVKRKVYLDECSLDLVFIREEYGYRVRITTPNSLLDKFHRVNKDTIAFDLVIE